MERMTDLEKEPDHLVVPVDFSYRDMRRTPNVWKIEMNNYLVLLIVHLFWVGVYADHDAQQYLRQ